MLNKGGAGGSGGNGQGRKITDIVAYKNVADMQHNNTLTVQVDHRSECVLAPIYGVLVPFHILTIKNASNNQVGLGQLGGEQLGGGQLGGGQLGGGQLRGGQPKFWAHALVFDDSSRLYARRCTYHDCHCARAHARAGW